LGGVGLVSGTVVGALIMGVLRNGLNLLNVSPAWQTVVIGLVIVAAVWVDVVRQRASERRQE
jgi:ribose transport system permease protein